MGGGNERLHMQVDEAKPQPAPGLVIDDGVELIAGFDRELLAGPTLSSDLVCGGESQLSGLFFAFENHVLSSFLGGHGSRAGPVLVLKDLDLS